MIYLIYGNRCEKVREKVRDIVSAQTKKKPDALHFRVTPESWEETNLEELLGGQGLFVQKYIVIFDNLIRGDAGETLLARLKEFAESEHIFIFSEGELTKEILKKFEKKAEKIQEISEKKEKQEKFNIFSLTDALGRRNKKELWVLYQRALLSGVSAEEIHPILFWQTRAMLGATNSESANEAGLNPFVYKKSLGFSKNYSEQELHDLSWDLVSIYHNTRRGLIDFESGLEKFVLGL